MQKFYFEKTDNRIFDSGKLPSINTVTLVNNSSTWVYERHSHKNLLEIVFIEKGKARYNLDNIEYHLEAGDVAIINQGTIHSEMKIEEQSLKSWVLSLSNVFVSNEVENTLIPEGINPILKSNEYYDFFVEKLHMIYHEVNFEQEHNKELCDLICSEILIYIQRIINRTSPQLNSENHSSLVLNIKKYIDSNFEKQITLDSLSKIFFVSTYYITHEMKKEMGISPINYLISRRIGEAQRLLLSTNDSVASISEKVGYHNIHYFTNLFKKRTGFSPTQFRETYSIS